MKRSQRLQNNTDPLFRFRLSVPTGDKISLEWISRQHNLSFSLRWLIQQAVEMNGFRDAFDNDLKDLEVNEKKGRRSEKVMLKEIAELELPAPATSPLNAKEPVSELSVLEVPVSESAPVKNNVVENNLRQQEILNEEPPKQPHKAPSSAIEKLNEMVNL